MRKASSLGSLVSQVGRSLKRFDVGLEAAKCADPEDDVCVEEVGKWWYLVVDPAGIRARLEPSYSKANKEWRFRDGELVEVRRRRKAGWTTWLQADDLGAGWLFDISPKDRSVRMVEVEVLEGERQFQVCVVDRVPVLPRPSQALRGRPLNKFQDCLESRAVVTVVRQVRQAVGLGPAFLELARGRGWVSYTSEAGICLLEEVCPQVFPMHGMPSGTDAPASSSRMPSAQSTYSSSSWAMGSSLSSGTSAEALGGDVGTQLRGLAAAEFERAEEGQWHYAVLDPCGISLRSRPTCDKIHKLPTRVEEGEIVSILTRRFAYGTAFLRSAEPAGWLFDKQPGKTSCLRMMEVTKEQGQWFYLVTAENGVALRCRCSFSESSRCGKGPLKGVLVEVEERVRIGESTFLRLKENGCWVFDVKGGKRILEGPMVVEIPPEGTMATVSAENGVFLLTYPAHKRAAHTKMRLLHGTQVVVRRLYEGDYGLRWAWVSTGEHAGWVSTATINLASRAETSLIPRKFTKEQVRAAWTASSPVGF
mmetsp:Transcript_2531/g.6330  ORF Transcript_2531/g.6330 Transcript_2531/m.6330 type:complete len:534 (-) Transcript_2531:67-1668(-)